MSRHDRAAQGSRGPRAARRPGTATAQAAPRPGRAGGAGLVQEPRLETAKRGRIDNAPVRRLIPPVLQPVRLIGLWPGEYEIAPDHLQLGMPPSHLVSVRPALAL